MKIQNVFRSCFPFALAVLVTGFAFADSPEYTAKLTTASGATVIKWNTASNWEDSHVPNGEDELVWINVPDGTSTPGYLRWSNIELGSGTTSIDRFVTNGWHTAISFPASTASVFLSLNTLAGFTSWYPIGWNRWSYAGPYSGLVVRDGTEAEPSVIPRYALGNLSKTTVSGTTEVKTIYGRGFFQKEGAGKLTFDCSTGPATGCYLVNGTLGLSGTPDLTHASAAGVPLFRFDASSDTITTSVTNGVTCVTRWSDADGRSPYLYENLFTYTHSSYSGNYWTNRSPFVSATLSPSGKRLVDFGPCRLWNGCDNPEHGSSSTPACSLRFSERMGRIRETFVALELFDSGFVLLGDSGGGVKRWAWSNGMGAFVGGNQPDSLGTLPIYRGDVRVDGVPFAPYCQYRAKRSGFCILSVKDSETLSGVYNLGCDRMGAAISALSGGFRLGEIVAYTNELTEAERRETIAYLKHKWMDSSAVERHDWSMGTVSLRGSSTAIDVAEGNSAKVRLVDDTGVTESTASYGIRKTGAGELVLDRVHPATTPIAVEGGSLAFAHDSAPAASAYAIAADPAAHYDATDESDFTYADAEAKTVSAWADADDAAKSATRIDDTHDYAVRDANGPDGKPAVNFGTDVVSTGARLRFPAVQAIDAFVVWKRLKNSNSGELPLLFSDSTLTASGQPHWHHVYNGRLLPRADRTDYGVATVTQGATWTVNGRICHPLETSFGILSGESKNCVSDWVVVHVAITSEYAKQIDALGADGSDYGGGCAIAEMIVYDRALTVKERHDTEAALMKKWLGTTHPDDVEWSGQATFADDIPMTVSTEIDKSAALSGGNGTFVKKGTGTLTVRNDIGSVGSNGVTVAAGGLVLPVEFASGALLHVDASVASTLVKKSDTTTGEIARWNDVRGNGRYAAACVKSGYTVYPVLRDDPGDATLKSGMPAVDFGNQTAQTTASGEGAAMLWYEADGTRLQPQNLHEVHVVYRDNPDSLAAAAATGDWHGQFLSWASATADSNLKYLYIRPNPNNTTFFSNKTLLFKTYQLLDNTCELMSNTAKSAVNNPGFHVVSIVSTNNCWADSFLYDRTSVFGGCSLCEVIVFDHTNETATCEALHEHLLKKWRDLAEEHSVEVPALTLAAGASLTLDAETAVKPASLTGEGTLVADVVAPPSLVLDGSLTVTGVFSSEGAVSVQARFPLSRNTSDYPLVLADSLDVDLSKWTLVETEIPKARTARFTQVGNEIHLVLVSKGLFMYLK